MLTELARREKAANIKPDHDIDVYMKVRTHFNQTSHSKLYLSISKVVNTCFFTLLPVVGFSYGRARIQYCDRIHTEGIVCYLWVQLNH
jgi:hypothetical protein